MKQIILTIIFCSIFYSCTDNSKKVDCIGNSSIVWGFDSLIYYRSCAELLNLHSIKIGILPDAVIEAKKLSKIVLDESVISNPKDFFGKLSQIKSFNELWITQKGHLIVPEEICLTKNIKILRFYSDTIEKFPDCFFSNEAIEELWVVGLTFDDSSFGKLKHLRILGFGSDQLTEIPDFVYKLEKLEFLDLSDTKILEIPERIGELKALKKIGLFNTPIERQEWKEIKEHKHETVYSNIRKNCSGCEILSNIH